MEGSKNVIIYPVKERATTLLASTPYRENRVIKALSLVPKPLTVMGICPINAAIAYKNMKSSIGIFMDIPRAIIYI